MMNRDRFTSDKQEYQLSCVEALVAGTLALMTGHAQAGRDSDREPMARKILANLAQLSSHGCLSPQFRLMLCNLQAHWQRLQSRVSPVQPPPDPRASHHPAPGRLQ